MEENISTYKRQYKNKKPGFQNLNEGRTERLLQHKENRKNNRLSVYMQQRKITPIKVNVCSKSPKESRLTKLLKWKNEKEKRKQLEKQLKNKPLFKVYHVNKDILMDATSVVNNTKIVKNKCYEYVQSKIDSGCVTRSTIKKNNKPCDHINQHNFAPNNYNFKAPGNVKPLKSKKETIKTKEERNNCNRMITRSQARKETPKNVIVMDADKKPQNNIKNKNVQKSASKLKIENTFPINNIKLRNSNFFDTKCTIAYGSIINNKENENKIEEQFDTSTCNLNKNNSLVLSPFVIVTRGKENARRESRIRHSYAYQQNEVLSNEINSELMKEKEEAKNFEYILDNEVKKLLSLCEIWNNVIESNDFSNNQNIKDEIDTVIGQTRLLIDKKFEQFRNLIHSCIEETGEKPILNSDLQGFWDMIYIQVENLNRRFNKLEEMKSNNWIEQYNEKLNVKKSILCPKKNNKQIGPTVGIKAMLQEARKKLTKKTESDICGYSNENEVHNFISDNINIDVSDSIKIIPDENLKQMSVEDMLVNKTRKLLNCTSSPGLTMLKITNIAKSVERNNGSEIIYDKSTNFPNMYQTPTKSILKTPKSGLKSRSILKNVLFQNDNATEDVNNKSENLLLNEDLISWETPKKAERRRSSRLIMKNNNLI